MSAPPRSKITMQTWIATAVNKPAESPIFNRSLTYLFYFLLPCHFLLQFTQQIITTTLGNPIKYVWQCPDCPGQPALCPLECFRMFHTKFDFY